MALENKGQEIKPEGVYRHPETGQEVVIKNDPQFGSPIADGFVQAGFVYAGPEVKETKEETKGK